MASISYFLADRPTGTSGCSATSSRRRLGLGRRRRRLPLQRCRRRCRLHRRTPHASTHRALRLGQVGQIATDNEHCLVVRMVVMNDFTKMPQIATGNEHC